jgi:ATP/maltotriose-dependent transcriptional regulator MalT
LVAFIVGGMAGRFVLPENHDHDDIVQWSESVANILVAPIFSAWADGRVVEAFNESQRVRRQLPKLPPEIQEHLAARLIDFSLLLGRLDDARNLAADLDDSDRRNALQATIAFAAGDKTRIREVLEAGIAIEESAVARSNVLLAMAAMRSGDIAAAKTRFRDATSELVVEDQGYYFVALDMLAAIIKTEGDLSGAIGLIERTMPQRNFAAHNQSGLFWLLCQRNLAKLYRDAGREGRAIQIEDELRSRFVLADKSFPLAQSLAGA